MRRLFFLFLTFLLLSASESQADNSLPVIHVIGDSHSLEFSNIPNTVLHWIGPHTMHRVGRDGLGFLNLKNFNVSEGDVVVFTFGEIDVRCHIGKQRDQYFRILNEVLDSLVNHYMYTILLNRLMYKDLTCVIYSVTPPTISHDPYFSCYGSLEDRINITKRLNTKLALLCQAYQIPFLNVYEDYANPDGSLNTQLSDGSVHINAAHYGPIYSKLFRILGVLP